MSGWMRSLVGSLRVAILQAAHILNVNDDAAGFKPLSILKILRQSFLSMSMRTMLLLP